MRMLVLGLGNELLGDDALGVLTVRRLSGELPDWVELAETSMYGLAMLDVILGHSHLIVIDAIKTGRWPVGTVVEIDPNGLGAVAAPSPHFSGLPEMQAIAHKLQLDFPDQIAVYAVEIEDGTCFGAPMNPAVAGAMEELTRKVKNQVHQWSPKDQSAVKSSCNCRSGCTSVKYPSGD
jgi:hydrogenase maturation protease